jgi:hypothetical protein
LSPILNWYLFVSEALKEEGEVVATALPTPAQTVTRSPHGVSRSETPEVNPPSEYAANSFSLHDYGVRS